MKKILVCFLLVLSSLFTASAQTIFPNTIIAKGTEISPTIKLSDLAWIQGHWRGEAFGGLAEEIWSPPMSGSMMFSFRLINDNQVIFYEFGFIIEENNSLILKLKHFHPDLTGWEEKNKSVDFKLVKVEKNKYFSTD